MAETRVEGLNNVLVRVEGESAFFEGEYLVRVEHRSFVALFT